MVAKADIFENLFKEARINAIRRAYIPKSLTKKYNVKKDLINGKIIISKK
jgi:hypothetical protein